MGEVLSSRMATLYELRTVYGASDLYLMLEVLMVDAANATMVNAHNNNKK